MSMITAFTSTTPSTITSIGDRLTACCQLMEIRSQGDPAAWFFLTNEEDSGQGTTFLKGTFSALSVLCVCVCVCVKDAWIVCGKLLFCSTPFFRKIRLFAICLFLGVFALCVFESWLNELTDRDLRAWQQMASCIFSPLPRQSTWKNRRTRSREKWDQRWTALECKRWSMSRHHVKSWSFQLCWFDTRPTSYDLS